jgi:hypothetical protein
MGTQSNARHKQLAAEGLSTPTDLALWARRRGLLSVYLKFSPAPDRSSESVWQVIRPGYDTDPEDTKHLGIKTFAAQGNVERILSLQDALVWLSITYGVDKWVSISGFPNTLFPIDTAKELREVCPSVSITNSQGRLVLSNSL